jgi:hypothetical protein
MTATSSQSGGRFVAVWASGMLMRSPVFWLGSGTVNLRSGNATLGNRELNSAWTGELAANPCVHDVLRVANELTVSFFDVVLKGTLLVPEENRVEWRK